MFFLFLFVAYIVIVPLVRVYLNDNDGQKQKSFDDKNFDKQAFAIAGLCSVIIMADNRFSRNELAIVKKFLAKNFSQEQGKKILVYLRDISKKNISLKISCLYANRSLSYHNKKSVVSLLFRLASENDGIDQTQSELLAQIMQHLNLSAHDKSLFWSTFSKCFKEGEQSNDYSDYKYQSKTTSSHTAAELNAYKKLGLKPGATKEEVKRAYRRLVRENHPDRFAGASEYERQKATERTAELNKAYDIIEKNM